MHVFLLFKYIFINFKLVAVWPLFSTSYIYIVNIITYMHIFNIFKINIKIK
nr:MAG TPA: hypothetical protein [Caudoviricetes sp.]